jgi:hypothetical protein
MKTRSNLSITVARRAPRNPYVAAALARRAGSHRAGSGALRQQARRDLQREMRAQPTQHRHSP